MQPNIDEFELPGIKVDNWSRRDLPPKELIKGRYIDLEPLSLTRLDEFEQVILLDSLDKNLFKYMPCGPIKTRQHLELMIDSLIKGSEVFFSVIDHESGKAVGLLSLMSIVPEHGTIEIGGVLFSSKMQRSRGSTEAIFLLAQLAMDKLGYRRLEWKCHSENERSKKAALRFGFVYEGLFRNHRVFNQHSRDSLWFSITIDEWPICRQSFEKWLNPDNFDKDGNQIQTLINIRNSIVNK
ncbi:hypothetical protein DLAC_01534 [Tieghemostelium lacteum]|uniref:N-acetyltransferase domain-containing protein n=1 Tax=Tieghemostelium lacteum TaxID=361077 RepID=A0A152A5N1_TIELA|nr:hypothetical protein DLAC_01534 [Tieghemostelium lacteum]|eukprot:KYR01540.1 hypothetical protein DLAC_01534 [Tieghemostelium lacteum]